jgi:hypothetical protein
MGLVVSRDKISGCRVVAPVCQSVWVENIAVDPAKVSKTVNYSERVGAVRGFARLRTQQNASLFDHFMG